jgi:hypothetical protein
VKKSARRSEALRAVCVVFVLSIVAFLVDRGTQTGTQTEIVVFGSLAVLVTGLRDGRSMALRPCFSTGLPLSNKWIERFK